MLTGDYDLAATRFHQSIREKCFPFTAYHYLGLLETLRGNPEKARDCFSKAVECARRHKQSDPDNPTILAYETLALAALGNSNESGLCLKSLIDMAVQDGEVVWNIARCYALMGNEEKSAEYCEVAVNTRAGPTLKELEIDPHFSIGSN